MTEISKTYAKIEPNQGLMVRSWRDHDLESLSVTFDTDKFPEGLRPVITPGSPEVNLINDKDEVVMTLQATSVDVGVIKGNKDV
jgi:hypothetical protein